jgi:hypothetical protein
MQSDEASPASGHTYHRDEMPHPLLLQSWHHVLIAMVQS